jgi:glycosyltransferase involved in cell wall biosynthesis
MNLRYILITPARNEESFIEGTIQSVIAQTMRPHQWIVVSDGSMDRTDEIVRQYALERSWMELIRMPERRDRTFAAKARCFNAACERLNGVPFDIIGNLDADITFGPDYFEYLLGKFADNPKLGVAGTPFVEDDSAPYDYRVANIEHVSGACQMFRRECFEEIGGYVPIKAGGIDWVAVTTARMKGWQTRTFTDRTCFHHRKMGTAKGSIYSAKFRLGREDYYLGGHPLWAILRAVSQMRHKPYVLGGLFLLLGYMTSAAKRIERPVSPELLHFCRKEQMQRLRKMLLKSIGS